MALPEWQREIADLSRDLFHLETNTILSDGITGRKMPSYPHALIDVAIRYNRFLRDQFGLELKAFWDVDLSGCGDDEGKKRERLKRFQLTGDTLFKDDPDSLTSDAIRNDIDTFLRLHYAAGYVLNRAATIKAARGALNEAALPVALRIKRNCDALVGIVEGLMRAEDARGSNNAKFLGRSRRELIALNERPPRPPTELIVRLRKIWDIGTDVIVMQTVLQLDGDMVNRVKRGFNLSQNEPLWTAHQRSIEFGVEHWQKMFDVLANLLGKAFQRLFG
ncbi:MAG: hypothetical protein GY791_02420 [Alphaproteobacteria bacterium]|nr:hypothetical protein [Alphaproteobacteria bacterium]